MTASSGLKRSLTLPLITFYGMGTIIGAGIYVLIGEVAAVAGPGMPFAFLLAGGIAALTGATYAELAARYPRSAGAALYVDIAFDQPRLSQLVALLLVLTGLVSAATITRGFVGYLELYVTLPGNLAIFLLVGSLALVAVWGIKESAWLASLITLIGCGGIVYAAGFTMVSGDLVIPAAADFSGQGILLATFLAFYAFIGFEDMVNVAEEVHNPTVNMPRAILLAMAGATLLYMILAIVAVLFSDLTRLAGSTSPLAELVAGDGFSVTLIGLVSLVAVVNGALAQLIMAARVLYGMSQRQLAPGVFGIIWLRTGTPAIGTLLIALVVLGFALWLPLVTLASITSGFTLALFALVNAALIVIRRRGEPTPLRVPTIVPWLGCLTSGALLCYQLLVLAA